MDDRRGHGSDGARRPRAGGATAERALGPDDVAVVAEAARALGRPLASGHPVSSFALHAPLELLARAALLEFVPVGERTEARRRVRLVAERYGGEGERLPTRPVALLAPERAAARLGAAVAAGDLDAVDAVAPALAPVHDPWLLRRLLADAVVGRLAAAGHANIFFELARRAPWVESGALVWPIARELAKAPGRVVAADGRGRGPGWAVEGVTSALASLALVGPPARFGIAPLVDHAEAAGALAPVRRAVRDRSGRHTGRVLLRAAAAAMLAGPEEHAPYGWTHCLTLARAALVQRDALAEPDRALEVAATYVAAHWACFATRPFVPAWCEPPTGRDGTAGGDLPGGGLVDGDLPGGSTARQVQQLPARALPALRRQLAVDASRANDAHHVKYVLACLDAAAEDPQGERLFLAAAAHLSAWWSDHPDPDDPLAAPEATRTTTPAA